MKNGKALFSGLAVAGRLGYLLAASFAALRYAWADRRRVLYQMEHIGVNSLPLSLFIGFFAGAIIAWQAAYQIQGMMSVAMLSGQAARVIAMEIGPVLTLLIIAGRIGASMTAEIGSMKITEQIDALRSLSIDPVRFVAMPRLAALLLMTPALSALAILFGVLGAFVVVSQFLGESPQTFLASVRQFFLPMDLAIGVGKSVVYGAAIAAIGCFYGLEAEGGSEGVGRATIRSFVVSAVGILLLDFMLWALIF